MSVCYQLRHFQNARNRGPTSSMQTQRADFSCHTLRSFEGQCLGWPVQVPTLFRCNPLSPARLLRDPVLHTPFVVITKPLERRDPATERTAVLQLSNGSPSSWSAHSRLSHHLPLNSHQIPWKVWGWLPKLIIAEGIVLTFSVKRAGSVSILRIHRL